MSYPCPVNRYTNEIKTLLRGWIHLITSIVLFIVMTIYQYFNYTIFAIFLCCLFSALFHFTDAKKYYMLSVGLECLDYIGINIVINAEIYKYINENYPDKIYFFYIYFLFECITDILVTIYRYMFNKEINTIIKQITHITSFIACVVILFQHITVMKLIILGTYLLSFYFFFNKNHNKNFNNIWSDHETFHLILLFAFLVNIYVSTL